MRNPIAEWFGFDVDAAVVQHLEGVAGAVAQRQHGMSAFDLFARFQADAPHAVRIVQQQVGDFRLKAIFAAQVFDGPAHGFHHGYQAEGADMGMCLGKNFFRRTGAHEFGQHLAAKMARVLDLAVELAIGKSAGAAFAELHIGFRIQHRLAPQAPGILRAFAHDLAALQDDGAKAGLRQDQACEQTARPCADHQRPLELRRRFGDGPIGHVRRGPGVFGWRDAIGQRHINGVDIENRTSAARIMAALENREVFQRRRRQLQLAQDRGLQGVRAVIQRQLDVGEAQQRSGSLVWNGFKALRLFSQKISTTVSC